MTLVFRIICNYFILGFLSVESQGKFKPVREHINFEFLNKTLGCDPPKAFEHYIRVVLLLIFSISTFVYLFHHILLYNKHNITFVTLDEN